MVDCPRWVMHNDRLCKVMSRRGNTLMIDSGWVNVAWHDPKSGYATEPSYDAVLLADCTPITDEVAQIMRSV